MSGSFSPAARIAGPVFALAAPALAALLLTAPAHAEPSSDRVCRGPAPAAGERLDGTILHVPDGRTVCIARSLDPDSWVALTIVGLPASTSRGTLMQAAFGRQAVCEARAGQTAVCTVDGAPLARTAGQPSDIRAGLAWREAGEGLRPASMR